MAALIGFVALALGVSFLCSVLEAVLLSVTPGYVAALSRERPELGRRLSALKDEIDSPLAAILSLNTVAHTIGAAGAGAQALKVFGSGSVAAASAVLTLLILVVSEIIPKTLGARHWKALAPISARILRVLIVLLYPLVLLSRGLTALMGGKGNEPSVSRAELRALADVVEREGVVDAVESRILRSLLKFRTLRAIDIMTPRNVLAAFDKVTTVGDAVEDEAQMRFSRLLVFDASIENVTGYALRHELMLAAAHGEGDKSLESFIRPIHVELETVALPQLLDVMLSKKEHIVLVLEELGGTAGVVTLEDLVETLLDLEIVDETDPTEDMRVWARKKRAERAKRLGLLD